MTDLLAGCGSSRIRRIPLGRAEWQDLITLDSNPDHNPDVVWDLESIPYPFPDDRFDEIHMYDVLEHMGRQGDWKALFDQFSELWRITKPNGLLAASCPTHDSIWAWGDPSHTRIINPGTLVFLDQDEYQGQVGRTAMSDFRFYYKAHWKPTHMQIDGDSFIFTLKAIKNA